MKPIAANLAQQKACFQYFPLQKVPSGQVDPLYPLHRGLPCSTKMEDSQSPQLIFKRYVRNRPEKKKKKKRSKELKQENKINSKVSNVTFFLFSFLCCC